MSGRGSRSQNGAALITVLMIVAAMSVVAVGVSQSVLRATERARALDSQAQLRYFAIAVEEVAKARLFEIVGPSEGRLSLDMPGYGEPQTIPVDGGVFVVTLRDAANCFDVNSLVSGLESKSLVGDATQIARFEALFATPDFDAFNVSALGAALVDWMDSDSISGPNGAEDSYYLGVSPSYRTSGQWLSSLEELRAIRGFDSETLRVMRPLLCARPGRVQGVTTRLNINTLEPHHAPLLHQALPDTVTLEDAATLIANRPLGGWIDIQAFQQEPPLNRIDPNLLQTDKLGVQTSLVEVTADVSYRGQVMNMRFLFQILPGEPVRTLQRQRVG